MNWQLTLKDGTVINQFENGVERNFYHFAFRPCDKVAFIGSEIQHYVYVPNGAHPFARRRYTDKQEEPICYILGWEGKTNRYFIFYPNGKVVQSDTR